MARSLTPAGPGERMASGFQSQPFPNPPHQPSTPWGLQVQGHESIPSNSLQTNSLATLLIRRLPEAIPLDTLSRLLSHYGAACVRPCSGGSLRNCAFVDFKDELTALQAQRQLNGLRFLGKVLSVERVSKPAEHNPHAGGESEKKTPKPLTKDSAETRESREGPNSGSHYAAESIAEKLGVDYPFPPYLEYAYPPPDGNILTNIVNALIAVPRFYTQVLHLMNKMNIPAPFRMALPTPPLPSAPAAPPVSRLLETEKPHQGNVSSDESEMETSDEEFNDGAQTQRKRMKREIIIGPGVDKNVAHEAVGLKPATLVPKEIPVIKKKNPVLQIKIAPKKIQCQTNDDSTVKEEPEKELVVEDTRPYATVEEIQSQKLPPEEILSLPMFKCLVTESHCLELWT